MAELLSQPRNIVVCFDGTSNTFGQTKTNVLRLVQSLNHDPDKQLIYYDPGVGTLPETGYVTGAGKRLSEIWGLAFGSGLTQKIQQAYEFLMDAWHPDNKVYIFGFSRGAYSARVLAGLLHAVGLLTKGNTNLVPYAMKYFQAVRHGTAANPSKFWAYLDQMRETMSRDCGTPDRRFPTHLLGLWDTVSSVGWIWDQLHFPFTGTNPSVSHIRHAISIDERRCFFRQNRFGVKDNHDLKEYWFAGSHGDIGGGYPEGEQAAWRVTFDWMIEEAAALQLDVDPSGLANVRQSPCNHEDHATDVIHDQLKIQKVWWIAEVVPKLVYQTKTKSRRLYLGLGRSRTIGPGSLIHRSVLHRIQTTTYRPAQFSKQFLDEIRQMTPLPEFLPFRD